MKKKINVLLLALCLLAVYVIPVSAKESLPPNSENICFALDTVEGIDLEIHKEESERLVRIGESVSKQRRATVILSGFKNLQQGDSKWKNVVMKTCNQTIGAAGCCLTSFTMIQRYYGGTDDPSQVNTKLGTAACPLNMEQQPQNTDILITWQVAQVYQIIQII